MLSINKEKINNKIKKIIKMIYNDLDEIVEEFNIKK